MYRIITVAIFFFLVTSIVKAQNFSFEVPTKYSYGRNHLRLADIDGSPYLDPDYKMGTIITSDGILYKDIPLKYNCYDDVLEFLKGDVAYDLKPKEKIKRAEFGGLVFIYKDYEEDKGIDKSFFQVLAEGKALLCTRFSIRFYEAEDAKGFADPKPAKFGDFTATYYISVNNSPAKRISSSKKLLEILADKKKDVESFISKQKLSVKKPGDLKKIVAYYNSL